MRQVLLTYLASPWTDPNHKRSSHGASLFALDGVRGLAVLIVIASHAGALGLGGQGSIGVLLFFTLSGFVLSLPYIEYPARCLDLREVARFIVNRSLRIFPIYAVAVLVIRWQRVESWPWALENLSLQSGWLHLWSVAEEARFYALFPAVLAILALLPNRRARMVALAGMIVAAWRFQNLHMIDMMMGGPMVPFYFWAFLAGILTALLYADLGRATSRLFGAALVLFFPLLFVTSEPFFQMVWRPLFPQIPEGFSMDGWHQPEMWCVLFVLFLVGVTTAPWSIASRLMQSGVMRHFGLLSYSLYLFHVPIGIAIEPSGLKGVALFAAVLSASYVAAVVSYLVVEKPFLMLKPKMPRSTTPPRSTQAIEPTPCRR